MSNAIALENARTGIFEPDIRSLSGFGSVQNMGFSRRISKNIGERMEFSCTGPGSQIDIYRVGYYGNRTLRLVVTIPNTPTDQPDSIDIPNSNGAKTCTNWSVTAYWDIPMESVSGFYLAVYRNDAGSNPFYIPFIVRDDAAESDVLYKTSDSTWASAYNHYGSPSDLNGKNLYGSGSGLGQIGDRSFCVDYHRPILTRRDVPQTYWMACELPLIRFLERSGYSVKYTTCVDLDQDAETQLSKTKIFLSSGHDEYWSRAMRTGIENWRDTKAGRSLFLSGNEVLWKSEYQHSGDRSTLWCRKDTMPGPGSHNAGQAFIPGEWQGTWKDTRWSQNEPEWLLTGTDFRMNGVNDFDPTIPTNPYSGHPVWGGSSLNDGDLTFQRAMGFEADSIRPTQPDQSVKVLASYTRDIPGMYADDNGQTYSNNGVLNWGIVSQRYLGGGLTVGFGTCQWSWLLDNEHDRGLRNEVSIDAQKFTTNLLHDLGATPATPIPGVALRNRVSLDAYGLDPSMVPGIGSSSLQYYDVDHWVDVEIL